MCNVIIVPDGSQILRSLIYEHDGTSENMMSILKESKPDIVCHLASISIYDHNIENIDSLIKRIDSRRNNEKNDNCEFENVKFQEKLKPLYESYWLRDIFERYGTRVEYLDAGISVEESRNQAVDIYKNFLENR